MTDYLEPIHDIKPHNDLEHIYLYINLKENIDNLLSSIKNKINFEHIFFIDRIRRDIEHDYLSIIKKLLEDKNIVVFKLSQSFLSGEGGVGESEKNSDKLKDQIQSIVKDNKKLYIYLPSIVYLLKAFDSKQNTGVMEKILEDISKTYPYNVKFFTIGTKVEFTLTQDIAPYFMELFSKNDLVKDTINNDLVKDTIFNNITNMLDLEKFKELDLKELDKYLFNSDKSKKKEFIDFNQNKLLKINAKQSIDEILKNKDFIKNYFNFDLSDIPNLTGNNDDILLKKLLTLYTKKIKAKNINTNLKEEVEKIHYSINRFGSTLSTYLFIKSFIERNKLDISSLSYKTLLIDNHGFRKDFFENNDFVKFAQKTYKGHEDKLYKLSKELIFFNKTLTSRKKLDRAPLISLLVGSTGSGKTEITKIFAKYIYENADEKNKKYLRYNIGEYRTQEKLEDFIQNLKREIALDPFRVIVLDEFEKGTEDMKYVLYKIFDSDLDIDYKGNTVDYTSTIFFLTSNLGVDSKIEGFTSYKEIMESLKKKYELSFLARIDMILYFDIFSSDFIEELIKKFNDEFFNTFGIEDKKKEEISLYNNNEEKDKTSIQLIKDKSDIINGGARDIRKKVFEVLKNKYIKLLN